jgi:hypothetical protein
MNNSRNSHCALSEEEEGGTMSNYLYRGTVAMGIVTSAWLSVATIKLTSLCPLLLINASVATVKLTSLCLSLLINARHYWSVRHVATI